MSITGNDLVEEILVEAGVNAPGDSLPSAKVTQVLNQVNRMIESWSLENIMIVANVLEDFALTAGQAEYTYGDGGDFDSERPITIKDSTFVRVGNTDYSVKYYDLDIYRSRSDKSESGTPQIISYSDEYPLGKVFLWPTPNTTDSIYLEVSKELTSFTDKTTSVNLPPGFERALIKNGAIEILNSFGKTVSRELATIAEKSLDAIRNNNKQPQKLAMSEFSGMVGRSGFRRW